jgi:chromate transporter
MKKNKAKILWDLFFTFFKIGAFTIGGGLAMLPIIEREIVDKKGYIDKEEIVDAFAVSQSLPGIIAINSAIYVGYRIAGFIGALVTVFGVVLPSFAIILAIAILFSTVSGNPIIDKALTGAKAGIAGVIAIAVVRLGKRIIKDIFSIVLAVVAFIAAFLFDINIALIIILGALSGLVFYRLRRIRKNGSA